MYNKMHRRKLAILLCFIFSVTYIVTYYNYKNKVLQDRITQQTILTLKQQLLDCNNNLNDTQKIIADISKYKQTLDNAPEFIVTAYDLSFASTNKYKSSRGYGRTKNGYDLRNKSWQEARTIAVDPSQIKLGSIVYLYFLDDAYKKYNNIYIANDTGSAIIGKKIDLFHGDYNSIKPAKEVLDFGVTKAKIILLDY